MGDLIGVVFTGQDKALLDRSARAAEAQAKLLGWESLTGSARKKSKLEYNRLMRDAHDLRLMGVRLTKVARALRTPVETAMLAPIPGRQVRSGKDRRTLHRLLNSETETERRSGFDRRQG